ncbi:MAG: nucleotide pyrophosphohydrolase [Planctomycetota bacterium]|nr:MAG: nucleotide pyrophosphohydrolase [Planctomycetota bacterium]
MQIRDFQQLIERIYYRKDSSRGLAATHMWFTEEVGELTRALRRGQDRANLEEEFADVLAWLSTLASIAGVDLEEAAAKKYAQGCPYCRSTPCSCGSG